MSQPVTSIPASNTGTGQGQPQRLNENLNNTLPSLDDIQNEFFKNEEEEQSPAAQAAEPAPQELQGQEPGHPPAEPPAEPQIKEQNHLDDFTQLTRQQRDLWKQQKQFKEERDKWNQEREQFQKERSSIDEHIRELMGLEDGEQPTQQQQVDMDQIKADLKAEIMGEIEADRNQRRESYEIDQTVKEYTGEIKSFLDEKAGDYPLSQGMGQSEAIFNIIEAKYQQDARDYGHDRAAEMMMTMDEAAGVMEQNLANEIKQVLQSEGVREFILREVNLLRSGNQSQEQKPPVNQAPNTLTNEQFHHASANPPAQSHAQTDEEAFMAALSLVPKDALKRS